MKRYWQVYQEFFKTCLAEASTYRMNFFLLFILEMIFSLIGFAHIDFIFSHVDHIGVWNREQFMFFVSFIMTVGHLHMVFISMNFWELSDNLIIGTFDFILLRPIHSLFIVFFRYIRIPSLPAGLVLWSLLIYFGLKAELAPISWALLPFMIGLSFILLALVEFLIATLMFWTTQGNGVNFLRMQLQGIGGYPDFVYQAFIRRIFIFVLPILLASSGPTHFLINPGQQWQQLCYLVLAILLLWLVLLKVWKFALNHYESASS